MNTHSHVHNLFFKVKSTENFTPNLRIVNSSGFPDCNPLLDFPFKIKPDITVYSVDSYPGVVTDSSKAEIFIEFKWKYGDDPFCDVHDVEHPTIKGGRTVKSFLRNTKAAKDTLGQITAYAAAQLGSQFRTHIYSILIVKDTARILRWDRSGTLVTEVIYYNKADHLVEFFRRYSEAPPEMRGKDMSVLDPTLAEAVKARQALNLDSTVSLVKITVPDTSNSQLHFIAASPRATPYTPPGRATRGFPAYDVSRRVPVFMKDSWRLDVPDIWPEGRVYQSLKASSVRHVPDCLSSGDISSDKYHATKTCHYTEMPWACYTTTHFTCHRHYRLALDVIGRSLTTFQSSHEMVSVVRDAIEGKLL